jgi:EmrB/QacA subfamily drug resistance transporter
MERIKNAINGVKQVNNDELPANAAEYKKGLLKWLPMVILSLALMIIIIDTTVLNVSLKTIVNDLNTTLVGLQWVITAYALTLAALTITGGRLGDLFGRKRMFVYGAIIFATGSFLTSISHSVGTMIIGESIIEGVGAALMMPATASLLVANYKGRDRAIAFGIWGGVAGAASALGPIVGGFLTTTYSWRWAFRINIVVVMVLLLGSYFIAESRERSKKPELDFVGVLLSASGLLAFVYGVIESSTFGWWMARHLYAILGHSVSPFGLSVTPLAMAVGVLLLAIFALWEKHVESKGRIPLVSLNLFRNRQFISGSSVTALMSLGMVGLIFAVPVFLQSVRNLDAFHTGLALLPMSLVVLLVAPGSAILGKHFTAKRIIQSGLVFAFTGSVVLRYLIRPAATGFSLAPGLMLFGIGMGLVMAQASNITLSAVSVEEAGEASGINNTLRQVGSSFGSAIIGAVLLTTLASSLVKGVNTSSVIPANVKPHLSQAVSAQSSSIELGGGQAKAEQAKLTPEVNAEMTRIAHQASTDGSRNAIMITGIFMLLALGASTFLPNTKDFEHKGEKTPAAGH